MSERSVVSEALDVLTLTEVWELTDRFGQGVPAPVRDGLCASPFRDDGKRDSFSVSKGLKRWKDFGGSEGGTNNLWNFVKLCRPEWSKVEIARYLVQRAGLTWTEPGQDRKELTAAEKRERRLEWQRKQREAHERMLRDAEAAKEFPLSREAVENPPRIVMSLFTDGNMTLHGDAGRMAKLAESRGWPVAWVEELAAQHKIAWARLRWSPGMKIAKDPETGNFSVVDFERELKPKCGFAFPVECPVFTGAKERLRAPWLRFVGYHVRYIRVERPREGETEREIKKQWDFMPCVPKEKPRYSPTEDALLEEARRRGIKRGDEWTPALPFVIGNFSADTRLLILTEGQWDAITVWGALGGLEVDSQFAPDLVSHVAVAGVRGASGDDVFLQFWGPWLKRVRPRVWILADNDKASERWDVRKAKPGKLPKPTFVERLAHAGLTVRLDRVKPHHGKDFNDYYQVAKPSIEAMWELVGKLKLMG